MINIYVGNLPYSIKSEELREAFEPYGDVVSAEVIFDRRTKRSRGYGFVEMSDESDGRRAIDELNGADFHGRELRVDESEAKDKKSDRGGDNAAGRNGSSTPRNVATADASAPGGFVGFVKKLFG